MQNSTFPLDALQSPPAHAPAERPADWLDADDGVRFGLIRCPTLLGQAAATEQAIWNEKAYGDLIEEGYDEHIAHSRTFAAFEQAECVGVCRLFAPHLQRLPPFLSKQLPIDDADERAMLTAGVMRGEVEELGTIAIVQSARHAAQMSQRLWRVAFRDAIGRGIRYWGAIMEPIRLQRANRRYGFTFRQLGPVRQYQGGQCAAHVLDFDAYQLASRRTHPEQYDWFVNKPLD